MSATIAPDDRLRLALSHAGRFGRRLKRAMMSAGPLRWRRARAGASQLLIAPPDLRTADPSLAAEIYAGRFVFAGRAEEAGGRSPFDLVPSSPDWERELHEFGWLRHLRAADTPLARANARAMVGEWLKRHRRPRGLPWEPEVATRRSLAFLSQSTMLMEGADHAAYRSFVRALAAHAVFLLSAYGGMEPGLPKLKVAAAVALAGLSMSRQEKLARAGLDRLDRELVLQILPDGGHISRNPGALVEALADLLPLRQALIARGEAPSQTLMTAIDRMMPMLRFFRHGDGAFAHFNGMGNTPASLCATLLTYDETMGRPVMSATHSGYERVEAGDALLLVDAGPPPPAPFSTTAHAGTLSFEFSVGAERLVVNCGAPASRHHDLRRAARTSAAHSTAILENQSSSRFAGPEPDAPIISGPGEVGHRRRQESGAVRLDLSHDGYVRRIGVAHERTLTLSRDGRLTGEDRFTGAVMGAGRGFTIRFHLHPTVHAQPGERPNEVHLATARGSLWRFEAALPVGIEESIYLSDVSGSRRTRQLVIAGGIREMPYVAWSLTPVA